jgi:hypothetical protein
LSRYAGNRMHSNVFLFTLITQHGKDYSDTPARKLSQSFGLEIVGGKAITPKQVQNPSVVYALLQITFYLYYMDNVHG